MHTDLYFFIKELIEKNPSFKVFRTTLELDTLIKLFIAANKKELPLNAHNEPDENRCFHKGKEVYLESNCYDDLWTLMIKQYRMEPYLDDPKKNSAEILNVINTNIEITHSNHILIELKKITEIIKNTQTSKIYPKIIKIINDSYNDDHKFADYFNKCIQNILCASLHQSTKKIKGILPITATSMFIKIGRSILDYFISLNPFLSKIAAYVNYCDDNLSVDISDNNYSILNRLVTAIQENDHIVQEEIYKSIDISKKGKTSFTDSKIFISLINDFIIYNLKFLDKNHQIKNTPLQEKLGLINIKKSKITLVEMEIGACFSEFLVNAKIFEIELLTFKKHSKKLIKVPSNIMDLLLQTHSVNKSFLHKSNLELLKNNTDIIYMMLNTKFIREHKDLTLTLKQHVGFAQARPHILYTINTSYLENIFKMLLGATNYIQDNKKENKECMYAYFTALDIDINSLISDIELSIKEPNYIIMKEQLKMIIAYSIDLNTCNYDHITQHLKNNNKHVFYIKFKQALCKIMQHKIIFINLIKECLILANFKHFFNKGFIDSRGRYYNASIYTNIQLYPIVKCLVKLYNPNPMENLSKTDFVRVKTFLENGFVSLNCSKRLSQFSFDNYRNDKLNLYVEYIFSYFKRDKKITLKNFTKDIITNMSLTSEELLNFVINHIKHKRRSLFIHSEILLLKEKYISDNKHQKHVSNYYELDATASGLQMISMILNNKELAEVCNLLGETKKDIYSHTAESCEQYFRKYLEIFKEFSSINTLDLPELLKRIDNLTRMKYKSRKAKAIIEEFRLLFQQSNPLKNFYENATLDTMFFSKAEYTFLKHSNYNHNVKFIFSLKYVLLFFSKLKVNSWLDFDTFFKRELFKKPVMTKIYNSKAFSRKKDLISFMLEYNPRLEETKDIRFFVDIFEKWFSSFMLKEYPAFEQSTMLTDQLAARKKDIIIENDYCTIEFNVSKMISKRHQTTTFSKKRSHQVTFSEKGDQKDSQIIKQKFMANYIHSADAFIMTHFHCRITSINNLLNHYNIPARFGVATNHDNFIITEPQFLRLLVEDSYYYFSEKDYLSTLKKNEEKEIPEESCIEEDETTVVPFKVSNYQSKDKNRFEKLNKNFIKY